MHIRHSHLILYLAVVGGFVVAADFPPQRHSPSSREEMRRARKQSQTAILQSVGKQSHGNRDALVSLSEELEMVAAAEATTVSSKKASPATVATPGNATAAAAAAPVITTTTESDVFRSYMQTHHKKYYAKYRADRRRSALMENMQEIQEHNKAFEAGSNRFRMAPNAFADMNNSEYRKRLVRLKMDPHRKVEPAVADEIVSSSNELPAELDWREKGFKTAPANQKTCGSCYAFSVAYAISAQLMKHIGRVELVSEQQMVDCSTANGNLGCGGGSLRNTLKYLEQAGGVMREVDYPYTSSVSVG
uniref:Cathepsin propeptide inhibitor domain-containing protein n=1 Tax=Anopheles melas TaxID=34690 RepID=A0A182TYA2_9DIPT